MGITAKLDRYQFNNKYFHSRSKGNATDAGTEIHGEIHYIAKNKKLPEKVHPQTVCFLNTLAKLGWEMIDAEVRVEDTTLGYHTKIDVMARDVQRGRTIVIEVKTTNATRSEAERELNNIHAEPKHKLPTTSPWSALPEFEFDTPVARAIAQVTLEYHLLWRSGRRDLEAFVVYLFWLTPAELTKENFGDFVGLWQPSPRALGSEFYQSLV